MLATACPRPLKGTRKRTKAKRKRLESQTAKSVRQQCVERDGYCALLWRTTWMPQIGRCSGRSEWAHIGKHRRSKTRGMAPEQRHTVYGSAMLCKGHHEAYDAHVFDIEPIEADRGMCGPFMVVMR